MDASNSEMDEPVSETQGERFNPYKPGIPFVAHRQTVQTLIRRRIMRRLIKVFTICLQEFQLQIEQK